MARELKAVEPKIIKPPKPKILLYGKPKTGKTYSAIEFPDCYVIDAEGGASLDHYVEKMKKSNARYLGPADGANDMDVVIEEVITLATTKHDRKTLVIDSLSKLINTQISKTLEHMERTGEKSAFGNEKKPAMQKFRRLIRWLDAIDMNIVIISHEKANWSNGEQVGVAPDAPEKLEYELHLAFQIFEQGPSRKARVTASRYLQFPKNSIMDWSFDGFANQFGRDIIFGDVKQLTLATTEQIDRFKELIEAVKVDPKIMEKWADACDDIADLTSEDIQKRIDWMAAKLPKVTVPS